jgi:geranylgeranyl diphosphate synthase type I
MDDGMKRIMERCCPAVDGAVAGYFDAKMLSEENSFIRGNIPVLKEYCLRPGKRIRPLLVIAAYEGYCGRNASAAVIDIAASAEIMHASFLVHDDIIDRAQTRRGLPTMDRLLQKKFFSDHNPLVGHDCGIVYGDLLIFAAMELVSSAAIDAQIKVSVMNEVLDIYRRTAWGQALDTVSSKPASFSAEDTAPSAISEMKTAYYTIAGPLRTGLFLSGRHSEDEAEKLTRASVPLGIAFQLRDDLLGVFGSAEKTGKSPDSDLAEGKYTLLVQDAVLSMGDAERKMFAELFSKTEPTAPDIAMMRLLIVKSGARERALREVQSLVSAARERIDALSIGGPGKEFLCGLCGLIGDMSGMDGNRGR